MSEKHRYWSASVSVLIATLEDRDAKIATLLAALLDLTALYEASPGRDPMWIFPLAYGGPSCRRKCELDAALMTIDKEVNKELR